MELCLNNCDNGGDATPPLCMSAESLAPMSRGGLTPSEVCLRDYAALNALTPYVCTTGAGYACCSADLESIDHAGMDLGTCTKDLEIKALEMNGVDKPGISVGYISGIILGMFFCMPLLM